MFIPCLIITHNDVQTMGYIEYNPTYEIVYTVFMYDNTQVNSDLIKKLCYTEPGGTYIEDQTYGKKAG